MKYPQNTLFNATAEKVAADKNTTTTVSYRNNSSAPFPYSIYPMWRDEDDSEYDFSEYDELDEGGYNCTYEEMTILETEDEEFFLDKHGKLKRQKFIYATFREIE